MMEIENIKINKDKYLCYCSKITYKEFEKELLSQSHNSLDALCNNLNLAKQCSACLPNIEDEYFNLKGKKNKVKNIIFFNEDYSFKDKLKKFIDFLSGDKLVSQQGHLPMLVSKFIKTWLIISNEKPSLINKEISPYKIELVIFNCNGNIVKKINHKINIHEKLQMCLSDYVPLPVNSIDSYYVKLLRSPTKKGFRGSTRPHFFYETHNSMSALHTQDGSRKNNFINLPLSNNKDKNMLFIINPSSSPAWIKPKLQTYFKENKEEDIKIKNFSIPSNGSRVLELDQIENTNKKYLFECKSSAKVKCYFIIADKDFKNVSVDHI